MERRKGWRGAPPGRLRGEITTPQPVTILELSETGARIEAGVPLLLDTTHDLRLVLDETSLALKIRVVHCHVSRIDHDRVAYSAGVEFVDPTDDVRRVLLQYLHGLRIERTPRA